MGISVPQAMYDDFVEVCKPVKEIRADYPFEVKVAKPFKRPTQSGGTDASVFELKPKKQKQTRYRPASIT